MRKVFYQIGLILLLWHTFALVNAQCPTTAFTTGTTYCISENVALNNTSTDATSYYWDFCSGDLHQTPTETSIFTIPGASNTRDMAIVEESGNWYGFVVDRNNNVVYRLDFENSLDNTPTSTTLTPTGEALSTAIPIQMVKESGNWYALIHNGGNQKIIRLEFGTDITNQSPNSVEAMTSIGTTGDNMSLVNDDGNWVAIIESINNNNFTMVDFGASVTNNPGVSDKITSSAIGGAGFIDAEYFNDCGNWYGLAVATNNKSLYRLDFGSDLYSAPSITSVGSNVFTNAPLSIDFTLELGDYIGYVQGFGGGLYQIDMGSDLSSITLNITEQTGIASAVTRSMTFQEEGGDWMAFQIQTNGTIYKIEFPNNCLGSVGYSTDQHPVGLSYSASGSYSISLKSYNSDGVFTEDYETVTVSSDMAPSISFSSTNECEGQINTFTPVDGGGLTYAWDFDNNGATDSTDPEPDHTFGSTGDFTVALTVDDGTCTNSVQETISIFPEPTTPTFFDSGSPYCTGADITFTNLFDETNYNGATLTYTWDYNSEGNSNDRDGTYNFSTAGTKTITLTASIPGCSTTSGDSDIDLVAGPSVDFSYGDKCLGDVTDFTNLTTGTGITGQTWDFGDSNGSTELSPSHTYTDDGDYNVSLTVDNDEGCSNTLVVPLTVDDVPVADFNMGVGCEGQAVGFEDATTVNSANIESYDWDFGGLGSSSQEDPIYIFETQGNYTIELTVESTYGCTDVVSKNLNVQLAPEAAFRIDLGCLDEATQFVDETETESENPINIWYWDINGDVIPNTQNPVEVFDTPGEYTATLTVTPSNLCTSTVTQDFTIHELPVADFTYEDTCDNQFTAFTDATTSATTNIIAYNWQFDDEGTGNSNPALFMFGQAGTYDIDLTVIDEVGCESSASTSVTINPSPTAAFSVSNDIGPAPLEVDFTNASEGATSYLWQFNDPNETTSTDTNPQFTYTDLDDYNASLIASNDFGCSDTLVVPISVADPILDLELIQISSEESEEQTSLTLTVRNIGNVPINGFDIRIDLENSSSVFERYDDVILRNETINYPLNFTFSTLNNNTEYVCISLIDLEPDYEDIDPVNNEKCFDFSQEVVVENTYPNPAPNNASTVRLNMILPTEAPIQIFLMDAAGNVLYQDIYQDTTIGLNSFFLDIYSFQQGLYFIKVIYNDVESTQRFMKL